MKVLHAQQKNGREWECILDYSCLMVGFNFDWAWRAIYLHIGPLILGTFNSTLGDRSR